MVEKVFMLAQLLADVKLSDGVCILFAFLILAVIVGISVFLYFRIKKNKDSVLNKKNESFQIISRVNNIFIENDINEYYKINKKRILSMEKFDYSIHPLKKKTKNKYE